MPLRRFEAHKHAWSPEVQRRAGWVALAVGAPPLLVVCALAATYWAQR